MNKMMVAIVSLMSALMFCACTSEIEKDSKVVDSYLKNNQGSNYSIVCIDSYTDPSAPFEDVEYEYTAKQNGVYYIFYVKGGKVTRDDYQQYVDGQVVSDIIWDEMRKSNTLPSSPNGVRLYCSLVARKKMDNSETTVDFSTAKDASDFVQLAAQEDAFCNIGINVDFTDGRDVNQQTWLYDMYEATKAAFPGSTVSLKVRSIDTTKSKILGVGDTPYSYRDRQTFMDGLRYKEK